VNLEARLKAYNKPIERAAHTFEPTDDLIHTSHFDAHPLSQKPLALAARLRTNFRETAEPAEFLFFDLESTGLGSGEHVFPFLIGCASASQQLTLWQFYAPTPASEVDVLTNFIKASRDKILVSFNGSSFDLPLIIRRAEKYNLKHNLRSLKHIDLYHQIRRIYPEKPARLIDAENRLLGFERSQDISGAEVAQGYFESLRFDNKNLKEKILQHNAWDILSLAALLQMVASAYDAAVEGKKSWAYKVHRDKSANRDEQKRLILEADKVDGRDLFALGQIFRSEKNHRKAALYFCKSYRAGLKHAIIHAVRQVAKLKKKQLTSRLAHFAVTREEEKIQTQLLRYLPHEF